jgi:hypothetical protein
LDNLGKAHLKVAEYIPRYYTAPVEDEQPDRRLTKFSGALQAQLLGQIRRILFGAEKPGGNNNNNLVLLENLDLGMDT